MKLKGLSLLLFACASGPAMAGHIYKCKHADGSVTYQDTACQNAADTEKTWAYRTPKPTSERAKGVARSDQAWQRAANQFAAQHPDLRYGHNLALLNKAMREVSTSRMNSWTVLQAGYARAKAMRGWTSRPPSQPASRSESNHVGGLGVSAYARGDIRAVRCTKASGKVYYAKGVCGTSTTTEIVAGRNWHNDTVQGMPDAVMVGPDQALNPRTGQVVQLDNVPNQTVVHVTTRDRAQSVSTDAACARAQAAEAKHPFSKSITRRVSKLCQQGRSLYDQKPSRGSLYITMSTVE
jgi:hypothetical protein